jgi:hypothetical protein
MKLLLLWILSLSLSVVVLGEFLDVDNHCMQIYTNQTSSGGNSWLTTCLQDCFCSAVLCECHDDQDVFQSTLSSDCIATSKATDVQALCVSMGISKGISCPQGQTLVASKPNKIENLACGANVAKLPSSGLSAGAIAGISVAATASVAAIVLFVTRKKWLKLRDDDEGKRLAQTPDAKL